MFCCLFKRDVLSLIWHQWWYRVFTIDVYAWYHTDMRPYAFRGFLVYTCSRLTKWQSKQYTLYNIWLRSIQNLPQNQNGVHVILWKAVLLSSFPFLLWHDEQKYLHLKYLHVSFSIYALHIHYILLHKYCNTMLSIYIAGF